MIAMLLMYASSYSHDSRHCTSRPGGSPKFLVVWVPMGNAIPLVSDRFPIFPHRSVRVDLVNRRYYYSGMRQSFQVLLVYKCAQIPEKLANLHNLSIPTVDVWRYGIQVGILQWIERNENLDTHKYEDM